jgi:hypothetical protein
MLGHSMIEHLRRVTNKCTVLQQIFSDRRTDHEKDARRIPPLSHAGAGEIRRRSYLPDTASLVGTNLLNKYWDSTSLSFQGK